MRLSLIEYKLMVIGSGMNNTEPLLYFHRLHCICLKSMHYQNRIFPPSLFFFFISIGRYKRYLALQQFISTCPSYLYDLKGGYTQLPVVVVSLFARLFAILEPDCEIPRNSAILKSTMKN